MINRDQLENGIVKYINEEIVKKSSGIMGIGLVAARELGVFKGVVNSKINEYMNNDIVKNVVLKDVVSESGNIDLEKLYSAVKKGVQEKGQFTVYGYILNENDIDMMYSSIKGS